MEVTSRAASLSEDQLRFNFRWMGVAFALNHGVVTTPKAVATSLLDRDVADIGNALIWLATLLSSLLLGAPIVGAIGAKRGILLGMSLYCVYVGGFTLAALFEDVESLTWLFFVGGCIAGGLAAGVLWTAQGGYFAATATLLASATGQSREAMTASLGGTFAFVYLVCEVVAKMLFSGLQELGLCTWHIGLCYTCIGALAFVMMTRAERLFVPSQSAPVRPMAKVLAAASLWSDPIIWLLSPTNLTFGFSAAFMNGYVNGSFTKQELGAKSVSFLAAISALSAAVFTRGFAPLSQIIGKGLVICIGAVCFLCIPLSLFAFNCCHGWGWSLSLLYMLQGAGRAVYESTNRAMFSDFFDGSKTEGAFANCILQSSLSFSICFFLQTSLSPKALEAIVLVLAALTPVSVVLARWLQRSREKYEAARMTVPVLDPESRVGG
mmetsp:Transcript_80996/g.153633  ORF Transcript_80996/g.153633 Transcript_80996/m.153633 type:complete len:437 (+) Transcript_80996:61-1371(+)